MREMKDSGIEWIGAIPQDWKTDRLQWHLKEINVSNNPIQTKNILSLTIEAGVIPYAEKGNQGNKAKEDYSQYKIAFPDTLVINSMNVIIGAVGISQYFGCVSPVYYVFEPIEGTDLRYIYYLFTNTGFQKEMRKYAKGILEIRLRISSNDMLKRIVPSPPFKEQQRIADYLDKMCAEIDTVLEKTRASIEEYKKLKQAVITQAVTKGIRGDRPMKDSGIEWIGDIPAEWDYTKAKNCVDIQNGSDPKTEGSIPVYGSGASSFKTCGEYKEGPSVLIGRKGATLHIPHYISTKFWNVDTAFNVYAKPNFDLKFYFYCACSFDYRFYISQTTLPSMTQTAYENMFLPLPSNDEQRAIASYLDNRCEEIDALIWKKQECLAEIENYKKSLIYEYVTGKKEVKTSVLAD